VVDENHVHRLLLTQGRSPPASRFRNTPRLEPARFCVNCRPPRTQRLRELAQLVSDASNSTSPHWAAARPRTMARFGFCSISASWWRSLSVIVIVDEKSDAILRAAGAPVRPRSSARWTWIARGRPSRWALRSGPARRSLPLPRNLQGQNRLPWVGEAFQRCRASPRR